MTEWRAIPDYPDYEVSDDGRVRRITPAGGTKCKELKPWLCKRGGYPSVKLRRERKSYTAVIHKLVASAFLGPCPIGLEICHNNGIPTDNTVENLRYDTRLSNIHDQWTHGTGHNVGRNFDKQGNRRLRPSS